MYFCSCETDGLTCVLWQKEKFHELKFNAVTLTVRGSSKVCMLQSVEVQVLIWLLELPFDHSQTRSGNQISRLRWLRIMYRACGRDPIFLTTVKLVKLSVIITSTNLRISSHVYVCQRLWMYQRNIGVISLSRWYYVMYCFVVQEH